MTKINILITGGAGFIGSNLYNKLSKNDLFHVEVVDNLSTGRFENIKDIDNRNFHFISFDDRFIIESIKQKKYDYIIHLAAKPSVQYSVENIHDSHDTNVSKTIKLLEASKGNIKRFIFASSSAVYGASFDKDWPTGIPEDTECLPGSPYALQKREVELYLEMMNKLFGFDYVAYRFFNVYGPYQYGGHAYANVISSWLNNMKDNKPLRLDGDGTQTRDFVYVDDIVDILIKSLDCTFNNRIINLGTNTSISCNDVLGILHNTNKDIKIVSAPKRIGDIYKTKASLKLFNENINHKFTTFESGITKTIKWWENGCK